LGVPIYPSPILKIDFVCSKSYKFNQHTESTQSKQGLSTLPHLEASSNSETLKNTIFFHFLESCSLEYLQDL